MEKYYVTSLINAQAQVDIINYKAQKLIQDPTTEKIIDVQPLKNGDGAVLIYFGSNDVYASCYTSDLIEQARELDVNEFPIQEYYQGPGQ